MYSIVFGGFSAESLQSRILDGKLYTITVKYVRMHKPDLHPAVPM
jgi:hypothetical protein